MTRYPSEIIAEEQNFDCAPLYTLASAAAASHELPHTNVNYVNSPISHISTTSIHSHRLTPLLQGPPHLSSPVLPISLDSSVTGYNEPDVPHWDSHQPFDVRGERRHAMLLRHYIDSLAPEVCRTGVLSRPLMLTVMQFDTCDIFSHFEFEVPRRARISRTLFYAILALAAKHESVMFNRTDGEAATYYVRCLDLLIPCLDPGNPIDETLFVTIILLRLYEERAGTNTTPCHPSPSAVLTEPNRRRRAPPPIRRNRPPQHHNLCLVRRPRRSRELDRTETTYISIPNTPSTPPDQPR